MLITDVTLYTSKIEELYDFYGEVLHFNCTEKNENVITFSVGHTILRFCSDENIDNFQNPYYHFAFNIPADKVDEAYHWLLEKVQIIPDETGSQIVDFPNWNARSIYFYDPAGNILEFIGRKDIPSGETKTFNTNQVFSLSELGIPVPDVKETSNAISRFLPHYWGDQKRFSALGDPQGLLIIVKQNSKTWFPTNIKAQPFKFECEFQTSKRQISISNINGLSLRTSD